ncbi:hypothetical protein M1N61_00280 [Peptococcaceae bacterium]|nr:hypothetical protein [Peptococcaceae bacterium]
MKKKHLLVALFLLVFIGIPFNVYAEEVTLSVVPGIKGVYKEGKPVYLSIIIENNGKAFEGEVIVKNFYRCDDTGVWIEIKDDPPLYKRKISVLEKGSTDTSIIVPGELVRKFSSEWGKMVVVLTDEYGRTVSQAVVQGTPIYGEFVVCFDENLLKSEVSAWLDKYGEGIFKAIEPADIPQDLNALITADCLIINESSAKKLDEAHLELIYKWVSHGGTLILSEGAGTVEGELFFDITPVVRKSYKNITTDLSGFLAEKREVELAVGDAVRGKILVSSDGIPIIAVNEIGKGFVMYSALDISAVKIDDKVLPVLINIKDFFDRDDLSHVVSMLADYSKYLPQVELPTFGFFAAVWAVYTVGVSFGFYFILKRFKKQDLMWVLVPVLSVVAILIIYALAPFHQFKGNFNNTLALIEILNRDTAQIAAASTCVAVRGGDVILEDKGMGMFHYYSGRYSRKSLSEVEQRENSTVFLIKDIPFWSVRSVGGLNITRNFGDIESALFIDGKHIRGRIYNNTQFDLTNCMLVINGYSIVEIGDLAKGEFKDVKYKLLDITRAYEEIKKFYSSLYFKDEALKPSDMKAIKQELERMAKGAIIIRKIAESSDAISVNFIGFAEDVPGLLEIEGDIENSKQSVVVLQSIDIAWGTDAFELPTGFVLREGIMEIIIREKMVKSEPGFRAMVEVKEMFGDIFLFEEMLREEGMRDGDIICSFVLNFPEQYRVDINSVELVDVRGRPVCAKTNKIEIYNHLTGEWETLSSSYVDLTAEDAKRKYLSQGITPNLIKFKISEQQNIDSMIYGLTVKGVVKK